MEDPTDLLTSLDEVLHDGAPPPLLSHLGPHDDDALRKPTSLALDDSRRNSLWMDDPRRVATGTHALEVGAASRTWGHEPASASWKVEPDCSSSAPPERIVKTASGFVVTIPTVPAVEESPDDKPLNLLVAGLTREIDDKSLKAKFEPFGNILSSVVMRGDNGVSRGFGFVLFQKGRDAQRAIKEMHGAPCGANVLNVRKSVHNGRSNECSSIFVKPLPQSATEADIRAIFASHGAISNVQLFVGVEERIPGLPPPPPPPGGHKANSAQVTFADVETARAVILHHNQRTSIMNPSGGEAVLTVKFAEMACAPPPPRPPAPLPMAPMSVPLAPAAAYAPMPFGAGMPTMAAPGGFPMMAAPHPMPYMQPMLVPQSGAHHLTYAAVPPGAAWYPAPQFVPYPAMSYAPMGAMQFPPR